MRLDLLLATLGLVIAIVAGVLQIFSQDIRGWMLGHMAPSTLPAVPPSRWIKASLKLLAVLGAITCVIGAILALPSGMWIRVPPAPTTDVSTISSGTPEPVVTDTALTAPVPGPTKPPTEPTTRIDGAEFAQIPAGAVTLGCTEGDRECARSDLPQQQVKFSKPFLMTTTEVTWEQFAACVTARKCKLPTPNARGADSGNIPVTGLDANEAQTYCDFLGARLPTEEEWEYAARAGQSGWRYPWGANFDRGAAVYADNSRSGPVAVKSRPPNAFGLYGMAGNVAEWCWGPADSKGERFVIVRGGSVESPAPRLRVSARTISAPGRFSPAIGFRCVRDAS